MKKININGREYIKISFLRHEIKTLKETIDLRYGGFSDFQKNAVKVAYGDIIRVIYEEELEAGLAHATSPEEIRAVHAAIYDMPGDFIVYRESDGSKNVVFFTEWNDGKAIIGAFDEAMVFSYESKAMEIAEQLGDGWKVMDISEEAFAVDKKLLDAILREKKYSRQDVEALKELLSEFLSHEDVDEEMKDRLWENVAKNIEEMEARGEIV